MKKSVISALAAIGAGALLLTSRKTIHRSLDAVTRRNDDPMRKLMVYLMMPAWLGGGLVDYLLHRRSKIETTSGFSEALIHSAMMTEVAPVILAGLFLEVNAGAIALMLAATAAHEGTAIWDTFFTTPRRVIDSAEQHTHSLLEMVPICITAAAITMHWDQFLSLLGQGRGPANIELRWKHPRVPARDIGLVLGAMGLLGALPHMDELRRCWRAEQEGRTGSDTPECAPVLFG
jgi:hypothetical protein